jgi:hypothetical protein
VALQPVLDLGRLVLSFQGHAQLDAHLSARQKGRYIHSMQHTQRTNIYALSYIRSHDPSNLASEGLSLRLHRYWDCHCAITTAMFI